MPTDQEHLAAAGITDTGDASLENATESPETTSTPATEAPSQPAVETFELSGNRFPITTEFQMTRNGKIERVPYKNLANTYSQAKFYEEKYLEGKQKLTEWEKQKAEYEKYKSTHDKYAPIQDWSEKNPEQWQKLWQIYNDKEKYLLNPNAQGQPNDPNNPLVQEIMNLKKELSEVKPVIGEWKTAKEQEVETKNVEFVKNEIGTFKKDFPEINLEDKDPEGVTLWGKIVQWGLQNGYREFTPAAMMYLRQPIAEAYRSRALNQQVAQKQQDFKAGVVKRSSNPISGQKEAQTMDVRKMSYGQISQMAKERLAGAGSS